MPAMLPRNGTACYMVPFLYAHSPKEPRWAAVDSNHLPPRFAGYSGSTTRRPLQDQITSQLLGSAPFVAALWHPDTTAPSTSDSAPAGAVGEMPRWRVRRPPAGRWSRRTPGSRQLQAAGQ